MAGDAIQAYGAIQDGNAAQEAGDYNARVANQNASYSLQKASEDERRARMNSTKIIGDMRANYGASGITMDGSALDTLQESAANAELDALTVRHEGAARSTAYQNEGIMELYQGAVAKKSSYLKAAAHLASAGEKAAKAAAGAK